MIKILPISPADAKDLAELDREIFSSPWSEKSFSDECKNEAAVYFVAKDNEKTVGYAGFWNVVDEGDITNIAVKEEYRRQKIASTLLEKIIEEAKKRELVLLTLEVRETNIPAINLYRKYGFEEVGKRKRYYTNPVEDAKIMTFYFGGKDG